MRLDSDTTPPRTVADALVSHDNAFGFLRLVLAAVVIVDHAFPLGGFGRDPMWAWSKDQDSLGGICVAGFFAISGYLIAKSSFTTDWLQFLWRRALRIFPAYWTVLVLTAVVVAPAIWWANHHELRHYFVRNGIGPFSYVYQNLLLEVRRYGVHDLLASTTPYGKLVNASVFNGSLWTLIYEWHCYLLVLVLALCGAFRSARMLAVGVTVGLYVLLNLQVVDASWPGRLAPWLKDPHTVRFTTIFMIGALAALFARRIPLDDRLGVLSVIVYFGSLFLGGYFTVGYPAMVYMLLWLAVRLPAVLRSVGARNDYSYGVYLYGFLVQQVLAFAGVHRLGLAPFIAIATAISFGCAYLSWHAIEKHAMRLKDAGPGRGVQALWEWVRSERSLSSSA
jgi:peptidoglycan/LPS O-acetylase OafA/YrhL